MLQLVHPGEFILADIQPRSCSKMYRHPACVQIFVNPVHSNNVEATFDFVEATFDFVAENGNNVEQVYRKISSFR